MSDPQPISFHVARNDETTSLHVVPQIIENCYAEFLDVDTTQDGWRQLSFSVDSLWKALYFSRYEKVHTSQPDELFVCISSGDQPAERIRTDYYLPLSRNPQQAVSVQYEYRVAEIRHRGDNVVRKLARTALYTPSKPVVNPFFSRSEETGQMPSNLSLGNRHMYNRIGKGNLGAYRV